MTGYVSHYESSFTSPLNAFVQNGEFKLYRAVPLVAAALVILWAAKRLLLVDVLPGVPQLQGVPLLGSTPEYFRDGMPPLIERLVTLGGEGISYAKCLNVTLVSIHDPVMMKEMLALSEHDASRDGTPGTMNWSPFPIMDRIIGKTLFTYEGAEVHLQRTAYSKVFSNAKGNSAAFASVAKVVSSHLDRLMNNTGHVKLDDLKHATDSFALELWGDYLYSNPSYYLNERVIPVSDQIIDMCGSPWPAVRYNLLALARLVRPGKPMASERVLHCQVASIVKQNIAALERHERDHPDAAPRAIRRLSMLTGGGASGPISNFATEFAHLNFFGGHHSIGSLLTWLLIELDRHPTCYEKLMAEVRDVDPLNAGFLDAKTPYLDAILKEVNRLYPTVHATVRAVNREITLTTSKTPVILKPGMLVYLSYLHLHTSTRYWGANAKEFVPERFLEGDAAKNPAYMPFGAGPRSCVGYKFAMLAIKVYLVQLLQTCTIEVLGKNYVVHVRTLVETNKPVAIAFTRRI